MAFATFVGGVLENRRDVCRKSVGVDNMSSKGSGSDTKPGPLASAAGANCALA